MELELLVELIGAEHRGGWSQLVGAEGGGDVQCGTITKKMAEEGREGSVNR